MLYLIFSRDGILRSIEESLQRLNLDYIDISVLIHDPDDYYEQALNESYPVLADLKSQGIIKAIGAGMNEWEMLAKFAVEADFDCFFGSRKIHTTRSFSYKYSKYLYM